MEGIKKIDSSNGGRYNDALHLEFHYTQRQLIASCSYLKELNIPQDVFENYDKCIAAEMELIHAVEVQRLQNMDDKRIGYVDLLFAVINNERKSPLLEHRQAAKNLESMMTPYKTMGELSNDERTERINDLVNAFLQRAYVPSVHTLGLAMVADALESINQEYAVLAQKVSRAEVTLTHEDSKTIRSRTDETYLAICSFIEASWLLAKDETAKTEVSHLVGSLNETIAKFKTLSKQKVTSSKKE